MQVPSDDPNSSILRVYVFVARFITTTSNLWKEAGISQKENISKKKKPVIENNFIKLEGKNVRKKIETEFSKILVMYINKI